MLSSEFVVIENPFPEDEKVVGIYLLNRNLFVYGIKSWVQFDMRGNQEETRSTRVDSAEWPILRK